MSFTTILLILLMAHQSFGVQLSDSDEVERYIQEIIKHFEENPTENKIFVNNSPSADKRCIFKSCSLHAKGITLEPTKTFFYFNDVPDS